VDKLIGLRKRLTALTALTALATDGLGRLTAEPTADLRQNLSSLTTGVFSTVEGSQAAECPNIRADSAGGATHPSQVRESLRRDKRGLHGLEGIVMTSRVAFGVPFADFVQRLEAAIRSAEARGGENTGA
jgi:hypothetical protein